MTAKQARPLRRWSLLVVSALALGFILFVLSFIVLATSRYLLRSRLKA